jgi:AcrR family transcriptional regulator
MGITERKERQKAELREQILDAARAIVARDGIGGLSMRKIAEAIEYAPATIYLYFQNREEIAAQLVVEGFAQLLAFFAPALAIEDPLARIYALGNAYVRFAEERPEQYRLIFMEDDELTQRVMGAKSEAGEPEMLGHSAFDVIASTVAELVEAKVFRPIDPADGARVLWAGLHGLIALKVSCPDSPFGDTDFAQLAAFMMETLSHGLVMPAAA